MFKKNILKMMYNYSPMSFYAFGDGCTVIKSINNTPLGYKFNKEFSQTEISKVWDEIKLCKRWSTVLIFLLLILLLYLVIFPNFSLFVNNPWFINAIVILAIVGFICHVITKICTFLFEKQLKNTFGEYEQVSFQHSKEIDNTYYKLFKTELIKALILIFVIVGCFSIGSPLKKAKSLIENEKYERAIKLTTIGANVFPIAQEWYSLRGYSKFYLSDFEGAINDFDKAYHLGADGLNIMNFDNKIFVKYYLGDYEGALQDFNNEIKNANSDDEKDQFLWDKAQFLYNIKNYKEALDLYSALIDKAESDRIYLLKDRLYLERAQVFKALGDENSANEDLINSGISEEENNQTPIPLPTLILGDF